MPLGEFSDKVFSAVRRIPQGTVATYGQIARMIGSPRSARYVGYALHANPAPGVDADSIPCHRVVFKDGRLCDGYAFGGPDKQRRLLEAEGVRFADDGRIDMEACQWDGRAMGNPNAKWADSGPEDVPAAPPEDFDWERELGEGQ